MNSDGKASPGGDFVPPRAELWNNMIDAGNAWRNGRFNSPAQPPTKSRGTDLLKLKNSSAANRRKGEILKIDGKVIETITDEHIWLDGVEPTDDCRFGILKYPADDGEVQTCQVSGVCLALVNVTDADHQFAVAVDGEYVLQSAFAGPIELLFVPEGLTPPIQVECVVRFGDCPRVQVIMKDDLLAAVNTKRDPSTADAYVLRKKANGDLRQTRDTIPIVNRFINISVDAGTYAKAEWIDGEWQLYAADCPGGSDSSGSSGSF